MLASACFHRTSSPPSTSNNLLTVASHIIHFYQRPWRDEQWTGGEMAPTQAAKRDGVDRTKRVSKHVLNKQQTHRQSQNSLAFTTTATHCVTTLFPSSLALILNETQESWWPGLTVFWHVLFSVTLLTGFKEDGILRGLENNIAFWIHYDHVHFKCSNTILFSKARKSNLNNLKENKPNNISIYMHIYIYTYTIYIYTHIYKHTPKY